MAAQRLGYAVEARYKGLIRVRAHEFQDKAQQQQDLEHGEEQGDDARHRPYRVGRRGSGRRTHVHVGSRGSRDRRTLDDALALIPFYPLGGVVVMWCRCSHAQ